jgi:hypothetical protein
MSIILENKTQTSGLDFGVQSDGSPEHLFVIRAAAWNYKQDFQFGRRWLWSSGVRRTDQM